MGTMTTASVGTVGDFMVGLVLSCNREDGTLGITQRRGVNNDLE